MSLSSLVCGRVYPVVLSVEWCAIVGNREPGARSRIQRTARPSALRGTARDNVMTNGPERCGKRAALALMLGIAHQLDATEERSE
jgi:hypothetical protein